MNFYQLVLGFTIFNAKALDTVIGLDLSSTYKATLLVLCRVALMLHA